MRGVVVMLGLAVAGCGGEGTWKLEAWGEDFIEEGIGDDVFADGCSMTYDRFLVLVRTRALLDDGGEEVASIDGAQVYDVSLPGPHPAGEAVAPRGTWRRMLVEIGPDASATPGNASQADVDALLAAGGSVSVAGTLTCPSGAVTFDWVFDTDTRYDCDPANLVVPVDGEGSAQLTIHGDHLFYDGLANPDAEVRGEALVAADANDDGVLTQAELAAAPVAPTGYTIGSASDVEDLGAFVAALTRSIGHVDGEGHCATSAE